MNANYGPVRNTKFSTKQISILPEFFDLIFNCSNSRVETLEKVVKYVQS